MLRTLALLGLFLLVALPFRGALDVDFLQDDYNVAALLGPELAFNAPTVYRLLHPPPDEEDTRLRPVSYLTLLVDLTFFGLNPFGLHLTGLLLHLVSVALVFQLARSLWPEARAFPWLAALFFGLNPVHADAVGWLAARSDPVVGAFSLATLLAYVRYRKTGRPAAAVACMVLYAAALLSKEASVVVPGLALCTEPVLKKRAKPGGWLPALCGLAILTLAYFLYRHHLFGVFLGEYGDRHASALAIRPGDVKYALTVLLASAPANALRGILLAMPLIFFALFFFLLRPPRHARRVLGHFALLVLATIVALLPVVPFLDHVAGRHFYLAAAPLALLLAAALAHPGLRGGAGRIVVVLAVLVYGLAEGAGLRDKLATYEESGRIARAARRDLDALRRAHPHMALFVVGGLRDSWKKAPLFFSGFTGMTKPPFQPESVPALPRFAREPRDLRWEAYNLEAPCVFLRLRTPPERPGLEPISPILSHGPPRRIATGYTLLEPAAGTDVQVDAGTTFRFQVPANGPWPRPLRLVFAFADGDVAPLLLGPENLREESDRTPGLRTLVWRPGHGVSGHAVPLPAPGAFATPLPARWWIEEADLDPSGIRVVPASRANPIRFVP